MMKKNKSENYLERIPVRRSDLTWSEDENKVITLEIENEGFFNKLAQKLLKKPKTTYIHLDNIGSAVWSEIDGVRNIIEIAELIEDTFGEEVNPLYERIAEYFRILNSYGFVSFKNLK